MVLHLDLFQTVALAVLVFFSGGLIKSKAEIFQRYCIPAPVIGGILFAVLALFLNLTGLLSLELDETMKTVFQTLFFTSVGYTASLKLLKKGGLQVLIFVGITTLLVLGQNALGILSARLFGLDGKLGLCVGSISMVGGHGTASSFGVLFEQEFGLEGADALANAAATFGLVVGGLIGGPIAKSLISKYDLHSSVVSTEDGYRDEFSEEDLSHSLNSENLLNAFCMLFLAAGIGSIISALIQKTGLKFPSYIGAMLAAAIIRNLSDAASVNFNMMENVISMLGNACLSLFLSMALMGLRLWELAHLAVPMIVMLVLQTLFMILFAYFVTFRAMGRDYEAAVMASASCGFGMGATPNAIANMQAITSLCGPAPRAFFIVPLVGSLFIDFINGGILTFLINFV